MFWADRIIAEIKTAFAERIQKGETLLIRDEKTLSGRPHIGSLRSASMHAFLLDDLTAQGIKAKYLYELNDTDALDSVPHYVPESWAEHLGKRLCDVPSPSGEFPNYAEEWAAGYCQAMLDAGFRVEFYRQSANYAAGKYDELIRTALEKKDLIRQIYREVSGSEKDENWLPIQVVCEKCGKIATTKTSDFDGSTVAYECISHHEFTGCGHSGRASPFGGNGTLPWKVEWAAKWTVNSADIEGAGKDHYTAGGSRQVANRIAVEVFGRPHPFDIRHEFILIGGAKMSSSKGTGATAEAIAAMLPRHIFRFLLLQKDPMKTINFTPDGDTIPLLFDGYDAALRQHYLPAADPKKNADQTRMLELIHAGEELPPALELPKFSQIVFLCQMPHLDIAEQVAEIKGSALTAAEKAELEIRIEYAQKWLVELAPEQYRFQLGDYTADYQLDETELKIVAAVADFLTQNPTATGHDTHTFLHTLKEQLGVEPKKLFQVFYRILLGRESGPQLGFMLGALPRAETIAILKKVAG